VLRAWEKRYGVLRPARSEGGRRLYSDDDIEYLRLLRRATAAGRNVGQVAGLDRAALEDTVREDEAAMAARPAPRGGPAGDAAMVERALRAVAALDGQALEGILRRAMIELEAVRFLDGVIVPLLTRIGEEWRQGHVTPAHEHLASSVTRGVLSEFTSTFVSQPNAPRFLSATPQGQRHEFGAMLAAAAAAAVGWRITYLGADLPAGAIAEAAQQTQAAVVGLSIVHPDDDPQLHAELRALRTALPPHAVLLVGGAGTRGYTRVLREIRAVVAPDLGALRATLVSLAAEVRAGA